jgi:3-phosphoshikimate 1-carboxyvinyltransferase
MRILAGLAARRKFLTVLDGDESLRRRPMDRVCDPLRMMGAAIDARDERLPPLRVRGGPLRGTDIDTGVASAQVKSAVMLAALGAEGHTTITEPAPTRDHTERMLRALGAPVRTEGRRIVVERFDVPPFELEVAGDPSSAAFLVAAAVLCGSVRIEDVLLNPVRIAFTQALARMGASVHTETMHERMGEPVGIIDAHRSTLAGIGIEGPIVPALIDELPLVAVLATQARGQTHATGAGELRVKETDRIAAIAAGLRAMGAPVEEHPDGFVVEGPVQLRGAIVESFGDHRIAMALAVAGLVADGETCIEGWEAADVSWPGFADALRSLGAEVRVA